jgi:hypothetical protein
MSNGGADGTADRGVQRRRHIEAGARALVVAAGLGLLLGVRLSNAA